MDGMDKLKKKKMKAYMDDRIPEAKMREMFNDKEMRKAAARKKVKRGEDKIKSMKMRRAMEEEYHEKGKPSGGAYENEAGSKEKWGRAKKRAMPTIKEREEMMDRRFKSDKEMESTYETRPSGARVFKRRRKKEVYMKEKK